MYKYITNHTILTHTTQSHQATAVAHGSQIRQNNLSRMKHLVTKQSQVSLIEWSVKSAFTGSISTQVLH